MLSKDKAELLVGLIMNDEDALSAISKQFESSFEVGERTSSLYGLALLFADPLLDHYQQVVSLWLLFTEFRDVAIAEHPFLAVFTHLFELRKTDPTACAPQLYDILSIILSGGSLDFLADCSVQTIMGPSFEIPAVDLANAPTAKVGKTRVSNVIVEKCENSGGRVISQTELLVAYLTDPSLYSEFDPPMARTVPSVAPVFPEELQGSYVCSCGIPPAFFDEFVSINSNEAAVAMIQRAADGKLKYAEIQPLSQKLEKNPELVLEAKLSIEKVEAMIDATPVIAADVFSILAVKEPKLVAYLAKTLISDTNVGVAKAVLMNKALPEESVDTYINGQIRCIQAVRDQQTYVKKIGLFCGMLSQVFCGGLRFKDKLLVDLYSFCVESKNETIKEAQELQALLSA